MELCAEPSNGFELMDMPHKGVAVVAAMRMELAPLFKGVRSQQIDGIEFFEIDKTVIAVGGVGRAAATRTTEAVLAKYRPEKVLSAGLVGAVTARLKVGDVVHAREVIDADSGAHFATADGGDGVLITVSSVSGPAEKRSLAQRWHADVLDMEAAAVARSAEARGKQFTVLKAVSDEVDFEFPAMQRFVDPDGSFSEIRFAWYAALRPWLWPRVIRLARNSNRAARALCRSLRTLSG